MIAEVAAIFLVCDGVGVSPQSATSSTTLSDGFNSASAQTTSITMRRGDERALVEIRGDVVKIKMPVSMQPPASGRGEDGWRTLTDTVITPDEIRGQFSYNWVNKPTVRIDRRTGEIRVAQRSVMAGMSSFDGTCRRQELPAEPLF